MTRIVDEERSANTGAPAIRVDHVSKYFQHANQVVHALNDVDLDVSPGEFISLIGPSGCGKSTLLRLIGGLLEPTGGEVRIGAESAHEARARKCFGFVPQTPALLPWRTVLDNATLLREVGKSWFRRTSEQPTQRDAPDPVTLLEQVGLGEFLDCLPKQLSGGMQQRVALVRAFVLGAPILLMDEPFAALDEITRNAMRYQLLDVWSRTTTTVVFVTHSINEAVILSDRVITIASRPGRVTDVEEITLPRPRTEDMEETPEFARHAHHVRTALRGGWNA